MILVLSRGVDIVAAEALLPGLFRSVETSCYEFVSRTCCALLPNCSTFEPIEIVEC